MSSVILPFSMHKYYQIQIMLLTISGVGPECLVKHCIYVNFYLIHVTIVLGFKEKITTHPCFVR